MILRTREIWHFRELVRNLTRVNLLLKYRGSVLGFLWSLLNPLMMMIIYSIAFRYILRIQLDNYTFFLLVGLLPWTFFSTAVLASTACVINNGGLIKKVQLPREVFPLSTVAFFFIQFALSMLVFGPFSLLWKEEFTWVNLLYLAMIGLFLLFTIGVCLMLSALTVLYRDLQHFSEIGIMALFWITPIIYNFDLIPEHWQLWFRVSPLTLFMNCFHDLMYWNRLPETRAVIGAVAWSFSFLLLGAAVFRQIDGRFAEEI